MVELKTQDCCVLYTYREVGLVSTDVGETGVGAGGKPEVFDADFHLLILSQKTSPPPQQ